MHSPNSFLIDPSYVLIVDVLSGVFFADIAIRFIHGYFAGAARVLDIKLIAYHYLT